MSDFRAEDWLAKPHGLAQRLREAREADGLQAKDLGTVLRWDPAKVSRTESGKRTPTADDIRAWGKATHLGETKTDELLAMLEEFHSLRSSFRERARYGRVPLQAEYSKLYADTAYFRIFQTAAVPGILQVPEYARQVLTDAGSLLDSPRDDVDAAVAERMRRQQALYDMGKRFEVILLESVLELLLCDPPVMRLQLDRLYSATGLPNVRVGIIPLRVRLSTAPQNSFVLYDDMVVVETFIGETRHFSEEAAQYAKVMEMLWSEAVEGDEARALITAAAKAVPLE